VPPHPVNKGFWERSDVSGFSGKTVLLLEARPHWQGSIANAGAAVLIGDVDDRAADTVVAITAAGGKAAYVADVTSAAAMTALVEECVSRFGSMDCAFNNAGVLHATPASRSHEAELDLPLTSIRRASFAMQAEIRHLKVGGGAIVNTASVGGVIADPVRLCRLQARRCRPDQGSRN
jgi:NAD(P)-dependent dehydrogenase (short-subunit alcohol dehydrogenase family)